MLEEIFDVKRNRSLLEMFLSPTDEEGKLKDVERWRKTSVLIFFINFINF